MMSGKIRERVDVETDEKGNDAASHPFEPWLRRELHVLFRDSESEPLPPEIAGFVEKLEEKLNEPRVRDKNRDDGTSA